MHPAIEHISPHEARARRDANPEEVVLLDCREPFELDLAGIDGAVHIPMGEIAARCTELDPSREVIVFCHTGIRSMSVTAFLGRQGFERVMNMAGGIDAWSRTVDPSVPCY
jgi:rhodanese-related sulfurtransferase